MNATTLFVARLQRASDGATVRAPSAEQSSDSILMPIQENLNRQGLSHLMVRRISPDDTSPVQANIVDRNGTVILSFSVDSVTGLMRDVR